MTPALHTLLAAGLILLATSQAGAQDAAVLKRVDSVATAASARNAQSEVDQIRRAADSIYTLSVERQNGLLGRNVDYLGVTIAVLAGLFTVGLFVAGGVIYRQSTEHRRHMARLKRRFDQHLASAKETFATQLADATAKNETNNETLRAGLTARIEGAIATAETVAAELRTTLVEEKANVSREQAAAPPGAESEQLKARVAALDARISALEPRKPDPPAAWETHYIVVDPVDIPQATQVLFTKGTERLRHYGVIDAERGLIIVTLLPGLMIDTVMRVLKDVGIKAQLATEKGVILDARPHRMGGAGNPGSQNPPPPRRTP
jgi:hypothetical protein